MHTTLEMTARSTITDDDYSIIVCGPAFISLSTHLHFLNLTSLSLSLWSFELATLQTDNRSFELLQPHVKVHNFLMNLIHDSQYTVPLEWPKYIQRFVLSMWHNGRFTCCLLNNVTLMTSSNYSSHKMKWLTASYMNVTQKLTLRTL